MSIGGKLEKKFLGALGIACVACCAGPLLALVGISTVSLASVFTQTIFYFVIGGVIILSLGYFIFKKQVTESTCGKEACKINCGCKSQ